MATPPNMRDVARRAGVSLGTVSHAINHPDRVRPDNLTRVQQAIRELGFVRNDSARQLRAGRSRLIAFLMLDQANPFFADVARGVDDVAREHNLGVFLCDSHNDPAREQNYLELLAEERVRGVLVTAVDPNSPLLSGYARRGTPLVLVDAAGPNGVCSVGVDDVEGGGLAMRHLLEQGHRQVAFVGGPLSIPQMRDRRVGVNQALRANGRDKHTLTTVETASPDIQSGREAGAMLAAQIGRPDAPTAAICGNDLLAVGVLQELLRRHIQVPQQIAIVGYDDIELAASTAVALTSVRQPRHQLGRTAAEILLDETAPGHTHRSIRFTPELIVRASSTPHASPPIV